MHDLSRTSGLRDRILLLLTLPTLALGCTSKGDTTEQTKTDAQRQPATDPATELTPPELTPPELTPPAADTSEQPPAAPAPLPEGAHVCFNPAKAKLLAVEGHKIDVNDECPRELDKDAVRPHYESSRRRTGGPWIISFEFVASDTPEGGETRCCYAQEYTRVPGSRPSRGRPLMVEGPGGAQMLVPALLEPDHRDDVWLADAQVELASVASFARANLELMAVGAPPRLLLANLRAATDELEHTRLCLSRAAVERVGAIEAVAPRPTTVHELTERTMLEACIPETLGALAAARAGKQARHEGRLVDAEIHDAIAQDEARHAAVAWATLRWLRSVDPVGVEARLRALRPAARAVLRGCAALEPALDERHTAQLWTELIEPLYLSPPAS